MWPLFLVCLPIAALLGYVAGTLVARKGAVISRVDADLMRHRLVWNTTMPNEMERLGYFLDSGYLIWRAHRDKCGRWLVGHAPGPELERQLEAECAREDWTAWSRASERQGMSEPVSKE